MEAKELRIGNIIKSEANLRQEMIVLQLFGDSLQADFGNGTRGGIMYENCNGIPLTEEWLIKFGFVLREESFHKFPTVRDTFDKTRIVERIDKKYFIYDEDVDDWRTFCAEVILDPKTLKIRAIGVSEIKNKFIVAGNIESVHQLQNLFFALTGEELQIKI